MAHRSARTDQGSAMNASTSLEEALEHYGTNLYRLALLLSPNQAAAITLLRQTVSRLQKHPYQSLGEDEFVQALIASLPANHQPNRRRSPEWVHLASIPSQIGLRTTLAQLEPNQRLALGLVHLYDFDITQVAQLMNIEPTGARQHISDALLAHAPHVELDIPIELLTDEATNIPCRLTRGLLRLGSDLAHNEPQSRGHLALCAECRSIEQAWQQLHHTVAQTVRDALRPYVLSSAQIAQITQPNRLKVNSLGEQFGRILFIALLVILVIALLVLPGRRAPMPMPQHSANEVSQPILPLELIEQALSNLYEPPDRKGAWHGRWEIQWRLHNGQRAPLIAERWIDYESRRHRVQLTHQDGGAPYELELVDANQKLWYAISRNYTPSVYPVSLPLDYARITRPIETEQIDAFLDARLSSGAWNLAAEYLKQARTAPTLQHWGRQRATDGRLLDILSYEGTSPIAANSSPDMLPLPTLILLFFDSERRTLTEVRELNGPAEGERNVDVTWRLLGDEQLTTTEAINEPLMSRYAWQGLNEPWAMEEPAIDPKLPLIGRSKAHSLTTTILTNPMFGMPAVPPPTTQRALLIESRENRLNNVYIGEDWMIALKHDTQPWQSNMRLHLSNDEFVEQGILIQLAEQPNDISKVQYIGPYNQILDIHASAINYDIGDLHKLLTSIGAPTLDSYKAHAPLMAEPKESDSDVVEQLLTTFLLPKVPENGDALRITAEKFSRQLHLIDPFSDPYHMPPYGGHPETIQTEVWYRFQEGQIEKSIVELWADDSTHIHQSIKNGTTASRAPSSTNIAIGLNGDLSYEQTIVYDLLHVGFEQISKAPDGSRTLISRQPLDQSRYAILRHSQLNQNGITSPYVMDLPQSSTIATHVSLDSEGRMQRIEVWAEQADSAPNVLLESWERQSDKQVAMTDIPRDIFPEPSRKQQTQNAMERRFASLSPDNGPVKISLIDAFSFLKSPMWKLSSERALLHSIEAANPTQPISYLQGNALQSALEEGYAIRSTYHFTDDNQLDDYIQIYQGNAQEFGDYLRTWDITRAGWRSSQAVSLTIGARHVDGWELTHLNGTKWIFLELDGTLLAIESTRENQRAMLAYLQPLT